MKDIWSAINFFECSSEYFTMGTIHASHCELTCSQVDLGMIDYQMT